MAGDGIRQSLNGVSAYLILLIAVSTLGSLQFGYHLSELNAPQDVITCNKKSITALLLLRAREWVTSSNPSDKTSSSGFLPDCIPMNEAAFATISSTFTIGGLLGALAAGPLSSSKGRLPAMRLTGILYLIGAIVETIAGSVFVMATGRLISGIGAGASTVVVPLYISEIAPPTSRGLFGSMTQISINIGILGVQILGYFLSYGNAWRWILGLGACLATAQIIGLTLVPESPSWLAANGEATKARRTLQRIRGSGRDISEETESWNHDDQDGSEEEALLQAEPTPVIVAPKIGTHLGFVDVVKDPLYRPAIIAVVGIMFAQQLCGINSIIMYSVSLLNDLLPISSALLTPLISAVNLITTVGCSPLPDRLGRKTCLLISIIGQGSSALTLAFSIVFGHQYLSAFAVLLFVAFYAVGLGPVPFIMASELVGQEAVGATQSWCLGANYIATFLVAQFFPIINKALNNHFGGQGWVYFIFAGLAAGSAVFISAKVPETKGKRDADEVWGRTRRAD